MRFLRADLSRRLRLQGRLKFTHTNDHSFFRGIPASVIIDEYIPEYDQSRIFDIIGRSRSSHFKKFGLRPNAYGEAKGTKFCKYLLVTANFPFENNRVLLW